ncbi:hypothetical protein [Glycomyces salinus]|uniref:hypothetical protein n=1 Tax=Glycomyces salinus TaxID=980294 RepID=UPI0018ED5F7A|nr:hypothetical protein [Glycomyces salinus]
MGVGRRAPHRVRAAYAHALEAIPLPVRAISAPVEEALTVLGTAEIGGRTVQFGTTIAAPRLWVAFADAIPPVFGYLSGLVTSQPQLHLTTEAHRDWTGQADHTDTLIGHGLAVWHEAQRWCEG